MASGTIYRRETPSGASSWVAHATWQEGGKRRQSKRSFRTKKEAQAALTELLAAHQTGTFVAPSRMPLRDFVEPWLAALENQGRKPTTLRGYRRSLDAYVLPRLGDVALQELRASDLDALYAELLRSGGRRGQGLSMTTVHHVHAAMNKMLHDAERKGLVIRNVAKLANAPTLTTARAKGPEMRVWLPDELARFLASIEGNRNEMLFRLMAMTGIRRGEVVALRWSDVELSGHRLTVNQAATVIDGDEVVAVPKTRRSRRVIDLDPDTVSMLQRHRARQREQFLMLGVSATASDRVFTNEIGEPLRPNSVGQAFRRLVDAVDLSVIRLHDLRHTHATHLLMAGVNVKVVSERLGHSSVSFTLDTYGHVMPGQQAEAAAAAAALINRPS
ncbi:MAG: tyrosine-type recombinase/integrase [Ilumatobacteraceae bacterium]|nr:tyrosine-type recombinase/integrase [Ilumatobacteraceae bacterium]